jgi:hypothetical protein
MGSVGAQFSIGRFPNVWIVYQFRIVVLLFSALMTHTGTPVNLENFLCVASFNKLPIY